MRTACFLLFFLLSVFPVSAQKDSVWLRCPLDDALIVPPSKNAIQFDETDYCVVLLSKPDTVVKACMLGRVSNVAESEDGKWDVVFFYRDYYFWYSGLNQVLVRKNDNLKAGQPIGYISPGDKMELTMYKFETPLDPVRYMECKSVLRSD